VKGPTRPRGVLKSSRKWAKKLQVRHENKKCENEKSIFNAVSSIARMLTAIKSTYVSLPPCFHGGLCP